MLSAAFSVAVVTNLVKTRAADANQIKNDLETLRRSLMKDNYDYMYDDTTATSTEDRQDDENIKPLKQKHRDRNPRSEDVESNDKLKYPKGNPRTEDIESNNKLKYSKHNSHYPKDRLEARKAHERVERSETNSGHEDIYKDDVFAKASIYDEMKYENISKYIVTSKYTILKPKHPSRRMIGQRFIQEEDGEGVALVSLDGGPVPPLRLPAARRQYMRGGGLLSGEVDASPEDLGADNALVELVKQNLRRNNDDYADTNYYIIETTPTIKNKITNARRVLFIEVSKDKYHQKQTITTEIVGTGKAKNDGIVMIENNKATPSYRLRAEKKEGNTSKSKNKQVKKGARNKVETFEKYIKKNKDIFKDFVSKKFEQTQNIMRQSRIPTVNKTQLDMINASTFNLTALRQFEQRQFEQRQNKVERNGEMPEEYLPDANLLDMAPAKGARMENKRLQGRLCDRNVLIPEGPKYDGRGRSYRAGRPPPHTAPPSLLLPRCCNCCKKSVLGCE